MAVKDTNDLREAGGPAFPIGAEGFSFTHGMTVRDYFAGQALAGLCANPGGPYQRDPTCGWSLTNCNQEIVARECYGMADTMLLERAAEKFPESDSAYRCRLLEAVELMNDLDRYAVSIATGEGLDEVGRHVKMPRGLRERGQK